MTITTDQNETMIYNPPDNIQLTEQAANFAKEYQALLQTISKDQTHETI